MPRYSQIERLGWQNGMVISGPVLKRPEGSATLIQNADILQGGVLQMRRGLQPVSQQTQEDSVPQSMEGLAEYKNASVHEMIWVAGTKWYTWDVPATKSTGVGTAGVAITGATGFTAGNKMHFTRWKYGNSSQDFLIGSNGVDAVSRYNGTNVASLGLSRVYNVTESYHGYLWGAELNDERVWRSNLFNATTESNIDYPLDSDDGNGVVGLKKHANTLFVFGRKVIEYIDGYNPDTFKNLPFSTTHGTMAHETIQSTKQGLFFLDSDGVYAIGAPNATESITRVSKAIDDVFRSIDFSKLSKAWARVYTNPKSKREEYRLFITLEGDPETNTFVVRKDLDNESPYLGWHVDIGYEGAIAAQGRDFNDVEVLYTGTKNGSISRHDQDRADNDQPVKFTFIDNPFSYGDLAHEKYLDELWIFYQANHRTVLKLSVYPDTRETPYTQDITLEADADIPDIYARNIRPSTKHFLEYSQAREIYISGMGLRGKYFQLSLISNEGWRDVRIIGYVAGSNLTKLQES